MDIVRRSNQNAENKLKNKNESEGDYLAPLEEAPRKKVSQEHLLYKVQENQSKKRKERCTFCNSSSATYKCIFVSVGYMRNAIKSIYKG